MQRFVQSALGLAVISCSLFACGSSGSPIASDHSPAAATPASAPTANSAGLTPARPGGQPGEAAQPAPTQEPPGSEAPAPEDYAVSRGRSLQWKRNAAFEADLMRGLELTRDELCQELGSQSCIRAVHTVALGGNDPFGSGLLRPAASSLSTTPLAVDRVTLSACSQRARADKQGDPKVFTALELSGAAPAPDAAVVTETITTLFRRLLARDPRPSEITTLQGLLAAEGESMTAEDFATLSCFVVASSLEALFF